MSNFIQSIGTLTIANGSTDSAALSGHDMYRDAATLTIYAPAVLPETVNVQVSVDGVNWRDLQVNGANLAVGAGQAITVHDLSFLFLRLHSSANVAAGRVFDVSKQMLAY